MIEEGSSAISADINELAALLNQILSLCPEKTPSSQEGRSLVSQALFSSDIDDIAKLVSQALPKLCRWHDLEARKIKVRLKQLLGKDPYGHIKILQNKAKKNQEAIQSLDLEKIKELLLKLKEISLKGRDSLAISQGRVEIDSAIKLSDPMEFRLAVITILDYMKGLQGKSVSIKKELRILLGLPIK